MTICVFLGPTLAARDVASLLDATCLPPVKQGDVYRAVSLLHPRAIGIIDGYFQSVPSVWHKEILWAIGQGVHVFGAASMGALRAAELAPFGMRGVGRIFEAYRDGTLADCGDELFEDDDEVAVVHGPPETGYVAASESLVNIRYTLTKAERDGVIDVATRAQLVAIGKALFFPERSYERLLEAGRTAGLSGAQLAALGAWLPAGHVNQKRADALAMLATLREFIATDPGPPRANFSFEHTTLWDRAIMALQPAAVHNAEETDVLNELRLDRRRFIALRQEVLHSLLAQPEADAGAEPPLDERLAADRNRESRGGESRLDAAARKKALRRAQNEIRPVLVERQMLARVRRSGEYGELLARAQHKRALLADRSDLPRADEFSELRLLQLRDWYFSRLVGEDMPEDFEQYLDDFGYPDAARFHEAIFAEYVYRHMADNEVVSRIPANA